MILVIQAKDKYQSRYNAFLELKFIVEQLANDRIAALGPLFGKFMLFPNANNSYYLMYNNYRYFWDGAIGPSSQAHKHVLLSSVKECLKH